MVDRRRLVHLASKMQQDNYNNNRVAETVSRRSNQRTPTDLQDTKFHETTCVTRIRHDSEGVVIKVEVVDQTT